MPETAEKLREEGPEAKIMSFWDHTEELASRLKIALYAFFIFFISAMIMPGDLSFLSNPLQNYQPLMGLVLNTIKNEILPPGVKLIGLEMTDPITLYLIGSLAFAVALTLPIAVYQVYRFIDPALYPNEKKDVYPVLTSVGVLLISGLIFGYKILTPYMMKAMMPFFQIVGAEMIVSVMDFYTLAIITTIAVGLCFTFPVYLVLLVKYGIISTSLISKNRKYVYAGILIASFLITPGDGGLVGNFLLFIPMVFLLEGGVIFAHRYEKNNSVPKLQRWFSNSESCKYCGASIESGAAFCSSCFKSQK